MNLNLTLDTLVLEYLENDIWDQLSDWELYQLKDIDQVECISIGHQWFAEYRGWA